MGFQCLEGRNAGSLCNVDVMQFRACCQSVKVADFYFHQFQRFQILAVGNKTKIYSLAGVYSCNFELFERSQTAKTWRRRARSTASAS